MSSIEEQITEMGINLLTKGFGVQESLAALLRQSFTQKLLTCSLESVDGFYIILGSPTETVLDTENKILASPMLLQRGSNDKHFLFSMTDKLWSVSTSFKTDFYTWITTIHLDITSNASIPLRAAIFKIADYFTKQCKKYLSGYLNLLYTISSTNTPSSGMSTSTFEHSLLSLLTNFSPNVKCSMVLDEDGYILQSAGIDSAVEELGAVLSDLIHRSTSELSRLQSTTCTSITLSDHEYTIQLVKIPGTTLLLAISASGNNAGMIARFLQKTALNAIANYVKRNGNLCGNTYFEPVAQMRKRTSWLSPPTLLPQGNFVAKIGTGSFHMPYCQLLQHVDAHQLEWFLTKNSALQKGLRSCTSCNP